MSLGFELLADGGVFRTVLGLDIEEAMVKAFNDNCPVESRSSVGICRKVDLTEFLNEGEVRAFYLDHLAATTGDDGLASELDALPLHPLRVFKSLIARVDADFLAKLDELKATPPFRTAYSGLGANTLGQTSVIGFHDALRLPMSSLRTAQLGPLVWVSPADEACSPEALEKVLSEKRVRDLRRKADEELARRWALEEQQLREKGKANGKGQLASSAKRISDFARFVASGPMQEIRALWLEWRSLRDALRIRFFEDESTCAALEKVYSGDRQVSVLLGGPPCQGFSRIGRGKIRSLREHGVQVHVDSEAGDERNKLLFKYVLFAAALAPKVFVFENVRHFQAEVKTPDGTFLATEVLEEALREISGAALQYRVAMRTVDGSVHLIPQTRERFFMVGIRSDVVREGGPIADIAAWCLDLEKQDPLPLRLTLEGLPRPLPIGGQREGGADLSKTVDVVFQPGPVNDAAGRYLSWVRQEPSHRKDRSSYLVDSHHVRPPRPDDEAFFALMGPGKRWMDYRCDESKTLQALREFISVAKNAAEAARGATRLPPALRELAELSSEKFEDLETALDGSLSLRLLLESIEPREGELEHHLLTPGYLGKREGHHGDWMARMAPERPSKTIVSHMGKDTYAYVHPFEPRTLSVREAARIQTFPDWFKFGELGLVDAFRVVGNAVPPLLSNQIAGRIAQVLWSAEVLDTASGNKPAARRSVAAG